ncbi:MAG: hypothetical protein AVDCRST_MAG01-01-1092, partial [uncultured Rubrobacteraceae bacterium]
ECPQANRPGARTGLRAGPRALRGQGRAWRGGV